MGSNVKIRAREVDGLIHLKCIISHPMETGLRKIKKTGKKISPHYIREVIVSRNNRIVMEAYWGRWVSRNPFLSLEIPGRKGDRIQVSWLDNRGNTGKGGARVR